MGATSRRRRPPKWHVKITRDLVLFTAGLGGVAHETLVSKSERPTLLVLFAGMMGLPVFLRQDEKRQESSESKLSSSSNDPADDP